MTAAFPAQYLGESRLEGYRSEKSQGFTIRISAAYATIPFGTY